MVMREFRLLNQIQGLKVTLAASCLFTLVLSSFFSISLFPKCAAPSIWQNQRNHPIFLKHPKIKVWICEIMDFPLHVLKVTLADSCLLVFSSSQSFPPCFIYLLISMLASHFYLRFLSKVCRWPLALLLLSPHPGSQNQILNVWRRWPFVASFS